MPKLKKCLVFALLFFVGYFSICFSQDLNKQMPQQTPIIVNGDKVEFFTELNKVIAEGNVEIEYGTTTLTCDRITVFTQTKDAFAEGNVKLEDEKGVIEGKNVFFNFDTKLGKIVEANIKISPYYGVSPQVEKFPTKIILYDADITTCNLDITHYHLHAKKVEIIPDDKLIAKRVKFVVGKKTPIIYLPFFVQDISEKRNGVSFTPGRSREWGDYLLTAYRYYFSDIEDIRGLLRLDYRANKGTAAGIDLEAYKQKLGDIRMQWYFISEYLHGRGEVEPIFKKHQRYKLEYRHKWDIDDSTQFTMELNDYSDANLLKNYFYRQYEINAQPRSYILVSHSYPNARASLLLQKRTNQFFSETEKIPEIKLETNKFKIMNLLGNKNEESDTSDKTETGHPIWMDLYYQHESSINGLTSRTAYTDEDEDVVYLDTYNQLSTPFKLAFFNLNLEPFIGERFTYFSKDKNGSEWLPRNVFYSGCSILTKFYHLFDNVKINSYGLEIDKLRHIITPSVSYSYTHEPTLPSERLTFGGISKNNSMTLSLENKLQTKRGGGSVDFITFIISSPYSFKQEEHGGRFGDITFDLEFLPNSWLKYWSDANFDLRRRSFRNANFDIEFPLDKKGGKLGASYRYSTGGDDSEIFAFSFQRYLNPKWKVRAYHRFNFSANQYEEQEYALARDLHCWEVEFSVNTKHKKGLSFWVAFKCKAFPEMGFDFEKSHHQPKTR